MRPWLARLSLLLSRATGGEQGEYLCQRIGRRWGTNCLFCRIVGAFLNEPDHCQVQVDTWAKTLAER